MRLLVSGATRTVRAFADHPNIGVLLRPGNGNKAIDGMVCAADNGAYSGFCDRDFVRMLETLPKTVEWVTAPDVVCDAAATLRLFDRWAPIIRSHGLRIALVTQNGMSVGCVPWDRIDALFLGGDNTHKLGPEGELLARSAKLKGKSLHMGRVNTLRRADYAASIGCDTIDGSGFSMFPDSRIPWFLRHFSSFGRQTQMNFWSASPPA